MDWNLPYVVSRCWSCRSARRATSSRAIPSRAIRTSSRPTGCRCSSRSAVVSALIAQNLLTPAADASAETSLATGGFGFRAQLDEDAFLSTSPAAPRTPNWAWNARPLDHLVTVEPGQQIPIVTELRTVRGLQHLRATLG
ncbi:MAG TPA: hypothetical protein VM076_00895 [Gemmatimonadaceae bacterium]|nr:hypothetical protein [Gemmatimonadaceae bacterium]